MSDSLTKAERSKAKDQRQMPAPDEPMRRKPSKKRKPVKVEVRWKVNHPLFGKWHRHGRYQDVETARHVVAEFERKHPAFEARIAK